MTRRRPSAWPTVIGAIALFAIVFQLLLFQATPGGVGSLVKGISLGENESFGDDGAPAKFISVAPAQQQAPAPVVSATS
jgi:hypothetical protein